MPAEQWERRQGMRQTDGWRWHRWQPCTDAEAQRVTGLQSWQVRRLCPCVACDGTGWAPVGGVVGINGLTQAETSATASALGIVGVPACQPTEAQYQRRQGIRNLDGELEWRSWQVCTQKEAARIDGLSSWQWRKVTIPAAGVPGTVNPACGVHGPIPCEGAGCTCGVAVGGHQTFSQQTPTVQEDGKA